MKQGFKKPPPKQLKKIVVGCAAVRAVFTPAQKATPAIAGMDECVPAFVGRCRPTRA